MSLRRRTTLTNGPPLPQDRHIAAVRVLERLPTGMHIRIMTTAGQRRSAWVSLMALSHGDGPGIEAVVPTDGGPSFGRTSHEIIHILRASHDPRSSTLPPIGSLDSDPGHHARAIARPGWRSLWGRVDPSLLPVLVLGIAALGAFVVVLLAVAAVLLAG